MQSTCASNGSKRRSKQTAADRFLDQKGVQTPIENTTQAGPNASGQPGAWEQVSLFVAQIDQPDIVNGASARRSTPPVPARRSRDLVRGDKHLRAARRLCREIRGQKANRGARVATGVAICGHLLAALDASADATHPQDPLRKV